MGKVDFAMDVRDRTITNLLSQVERLKTELQEVKNADKIRTKRVDGLIKLVTVAMEDILQVKEAVADKLVKKATTAARTQQLHKMDLALRALNSKRVLFVDC